MVLSRASCVGRRERLGQLKTPGAAPGLPELPEGRWRQWAAFTLAVPRRMLSHWEGRVSRAEVRDTTAAVRRRAFS